MNTNNKPEGQMIKALIENLTGDQIISAIAIVCATIFATVWVIIASCN